MDQNYNTFFEIHW